MLQRSFCFEEITDHTKAKEGDILSYKTYRHVVIYAGKDKYYGHTTDRCSATVTWNDVRIFHYNDDDPNRICFQYDGTTYAKMVSKSSSSSSGASGPGGDHPDDNFSVSTPPVVNLEDYSNESSPIGLLNNGFPSEMLKVLSTFNHEARVIPVDGLNPGLADKMPLLIIPSGGLAGLSESQIFKTSLEEYVKQGGTVLVLSQQHGYEFSAIPGGLGGYGWTEDQSCQTYSSYIETWHPVLGGQTSATPSLNVDGYFTTIPDTATVLLRRAANGQPALITYPYGNGRIIALTAYTDFAYSAGQAQMDELKLLRDIVSYGLSPATLPEIRHGQTANMNIEIKNPSDMDGATLTRITIYDPDLKEEKTSFEVPIDLAPGQTIQLPVSYTATDTDPTGIYHVKYNLLGEGNILLTSEEEPDGAATWVQYQLLAPREELTGRFNG